MNRRCRFSLFALLAILFLSHGVSAEPRFVPPRVTDQDATIRSQIRDDWKTPQRQLWTIQYHPIRGMESRSEWHVAGTIWRVRVHPEWVKLDEFEKNVVYEIDAVALDQNYGVIDFYVHNKQPVAK